MTTLEAIDKALWIAVAADATGKVIEDEILEEYFADPIGTFATLNEWPARIYVVRGEALPYVLSDDTRHMEPKLPRNDVLREVQADILPPDDVEFEWARTKAIAAAANSDKTPLPSGPTGGY